MFLGHDLQSIPEFAAKRRILESGAVFSELERSHSVGKPKAVESLAGLLCAKEAFIKAVGGIENAIDFSFRDIEIRHRDTGGPFFAFSERLRGWLENNQLSIEVSISHSGEYASATVLIYPNDA